MVAPPRPPPSCWPLYFIKTQTWRGVAGGGCMDGLLQPVWVECGSAWPCVFSGGVCGNRLQTTWQPPPPSHSGEDGSSSRAAREPTNHRSSNLLSGAAQRRGQRSNKCGGMELLSHVNVAVNKAASFQSCRGGDHGGRGGNRKWRVGSRWRRSGGVLARHRFSKYVGFISQPVEHVGKRGGPFKKRPRR